MVNNSIMQIDCLNSFCSSVSWQQKWPEIRRAVIYCNTKAGEKKEKGERRDMQQEMPKADTVYFMLR